MTGPEHYREAERLLTTPITAADEMQALVAAQVHATLALAAATALESSGAMDAEDPDYLAWYAAVGIAAPIRSTP